MSHATTLPNAITFEVFVYHYYSAVPWERTRPRSVATDRACEWLVNAGLLEMTTDYSGYRLTEKGIVFWNALITVPLPIRNMSWIIPEKTNGSRT